MKPSWRRNPGEIQGGGEEDPDFPEQMHGHKPRRGSKLVPLLIFAVFAVFVLKDQFPTIDDKIQSLLHPQAFKAIQACRQAALTGSNNPDFTRLLEFGRANKTQNGFFIDQLVIGELESGKGEIRKAVQCYVDSAGVIVDIQRQAVTAIPTLESSPASDDQSN
jgi:hypothetical protein